MRTLYSEWDCHATAWLRELIAEGAIPLGDVDERDIRDVEAKELEEYQHVALFAGVGGWAEALRLANWPDAAGTVWSVSCPCPPFSAAGKKQRCPTCGGRPVPHPLRTGYFVCLECERPWLADKRHLWPEVYRLLRDTPEDHRPATIFGEQVSGNDGLLWFAGVRATLESLGYAVGAIDLPAACLGSPHIRQRLWWVALRLADTDSRERWWAAIQPRESSRANEDTQESRRCGMSGRLADADDAQRWPDGTTHRGGEGGQAARPGGLLTTGGLADAGCSGIRDERQPMAAAAGGDPPAGHQRKRVRFDFRDGGATLTAEQQAIIDRYGYWPGPCPDCGQPGCSAESCAARRLGHAFGAGSQGRRPRLRERPDDRASGESPGEPGDSGRLGDTQGGRPQGRSNINRVDQSPSGDWSSKSIRDGCNSDLRAWDDFDIIACLDDESRRIPRQSQPGLQPLADGLPADLAAVWAEVAAGYPLAKVKVSGKSALLRGAGNAIVPQVAALFIRTVMKVLEEER